MECMDGLVAWYLSDEREKGRELNVKFMFDLVCHCDSGKGKRIIYYLLLSSWTDYCIEFRMMGRIGNGTCVRPRKFNSEGLFKVPQCKEPEMT